MPVFEYECRDCNGVFERLTRSISADPGVITCPGCESTNVHKVISLFGVSSSDSGGGLPLPGMGGGGHTHNGIT